MRFHRAMKAPFLLSLLTAALSASAAAPAVHLWQTNLVIPTYLAAPASPVPRFYSGRTYQGAKATFYPYAVQDKLTDVKTNKAYQALFLENQYVQIVVLPELGGRIFSAMDKGNGYDFFYRQHVIKPALIGMLGAWISGGVEWNVPHHHRATSFMPVDYTTATNADGSKTIWVGETELRHRMKWLVGMTLYPDRSCLELTCKMFNRTPFAHPMLFWINPAVHANENYQVIFPPDTEWAVQHGKPEFASWPIARQFYGGTDYTRGVDISWWKSHPNPVSFFCFHSDQDFFGGYDHGKQAGVLHVADHHVVPGKKFFEWGNGPEGEMWSKILTDEDGPYLELMAGAWSDNQPDYSWIQPGETREWKHWWYPIRHLGGVKAATVDAAVNLEITNRLAKIFLNATKQYNDAQLRLELAGKTLFEKKIAINPAAPFATEVKLENEAAAEKVRVSLLSSDGRELVSYQPQPSKNTPKPKPVERPKSPKDYATADELYFTGQRIEQLYSPSFEAAPYYEEILRRDPGDYRANTALGIVLCKQWRWAEAEKHLRAGIERATANYIRPKDTEAFYYLGIALKAQGKFDDACNALQQAVWAPAWQVAGYYALAEIDSIRGRNAAALEMVDRSLNVRASNLAARNLKTSLLRAMRRLDDAESLARGTLAFDPLNAPAAHELLLLSLCPGKEQSRVESASRFFRLAEDRVETFLELAAGYENAGLWIEAAHVLNLGSQILERQSQTNPAVLYHMAFCLDKAAQSGETTRPFYSRASQAAAEYVFPNRFEEEAIFRRAMDVDPKDAHAAYYLGNLLYDNQPSEAIKAWEKSRELDPSFAFVHRNLGLAYAQHEKDIPKAIASLEKAVELDPKEPRFFYELDVQYEAGGAPVAKRLDMLTRHHEAVAGRDDSLTREIVLLTAAGQGERALELLRGRRFRNWEGSSEIHNVYANACLRSGQQHFAAKQYREALRDYEAALEYPANLEVGKARRASRAAQVQYLIGAAHAALGDADAAKAAFEKATARKESAASESQYYYALALQKLGRADEATRIFAGLVTAGEEQLTRSEAPDYFAKFGEKQSERVRKAQAHYLTGLGRLGQGQQTEAAAAFQKALEADPAHLGANVQLAALGK